MVSPISLETTDEARALALRYGYSQALMNRYVHFFPEHQKLIERMESPTPEAIRTNTLRTTSDDLKTRLERKGFVLAPLSFCDYAFSLVKEKISSGATTEYLLGHYFKQDAASLLPVLALAPEKNETVIDLCAAPGGKTTHIAQLMENGGTLLAFDNSESRMLPLRSNLSRCGVENVFTLLIDAANGEMIKKRGIRADKILLDAPCSCEGTIPSDPSRKKGTLDEFERCAGGQRRLLKSAAELLKSGGTLVYSTCTFAPEENELNVVYAVEELGLEPVDFAIEGIRLEDALQKIGEAALPPYVARAKRVYPHIHNMHGFFIAKFVKA